MVGALTWDPAKGQVRKQVNYIAFDFDLGFVEMINCNNAANDGYLYMDSGGWAGDCTDCADLNREDFDANACGPCLERCASADNITGNGVTPCNFIPCPENAKPSNGTCRCIEGCSSETPLEWNFTEQRWEGICDHQSACPLASTKPECGNCWPTHYGFRSPTLRDCFPCSDLHRQDGDGITCGACEDNYFHPGDGASSANTACSPCQTECASPNDCVSAPCDKLSAGVTCESCSASNGDDGDGITCGSCTSGFYRAQNDWDVGCNTHCSACRTCGANQTILEPCLASQDRVCSATGDFTTDAPSLHLSMSSPFCPLHSSGLLPVRAIARATIACLCTKLSIPPLWRVHHLR